MDKYIRHKKIVKELLDEIISYLPKDSYIEILPIIDEKNGQFLLYSDGWEETWRDYACFFHVEVKSNGKIYLRHDGTDLEIANQLLRKGVSKQDIVLAFHAPYKRKLSGFALA